ncbi:efflux RND transporter permease subunit [Candidatus Dojkabacteria bacterium]|uniref:Efflux RND transporter permease subunit n=1 Tax=Candidatus Dojkabacteria bacterium TaxID=2099670 RepID=A0A955RKD2_9BACT|nr:efflux RND transporter permease subunit [Candidatus Dojkabacteria bacterium]
MESSDSQYLDKITFDPALLKSLMAGLIRNTRLIVLILITLITLGVYSFSTLPRETNPEINIPIVLANVPFPGANPTDIEELIIKPIENEVVDIEGIDSINSNATTGLGSVTITFVASKDIDKAVDEVQDRIDILQFPEDALDPIIQKLDFNQIAVLDVLLYSDIDRISLSKVAKEIKEDLEATTEVSSVTTFGYAEEQISVDLDLDQLQNFGITPADIIRVLQNNDITFPSGTVSINDVRYQVSIDNSFKTIEDVRNQSLHVDGQTIPLQEIADIRYEQAEGTNEVEFIASDGLKSNAIQLQILKSDTVDIQEAVEVAQEEINRIQNEYPNIHVKELENFSDEIDTQFGDLFDNFATTILLVFAILFIFLGLKQASIASISIPLTFLSAFTIMQFTGITLNFLSLFSLLLALGLVVDDAIVIVSAYTMYRRSEKFKSPIEVGLMVFKDFKVPIYTTTLTTVWAFVPLLLSSGIIGEFIKSIPIVVTATLLSSTSIAVFINIPLVVILDKLKLPARVVFFLFFTALLLGLCFLSNLILFSAIGVVSPGQVFLRLSLLIALFISGIWVFINRKTLFSPKREVFATVRTAKKKHSSRIQNYLDNGIVDFSRIRDKYGKLLHKVLFTPRLQITIIIATAVFVVGSFMLVILGLTSVELFPSEDTDKLYVTLEGPSGWSEDRIRNELITASEIALDNEDVIDITSINGLTIKSDLSVQRGDNLGYLILQLDENSPRSNYVIANELKPQLRSSMSIKSNVITIGNGGPPTGADIQVNISGDELDVLESIANDFIEVLEDNQNADNVESSLVQSPGQIAIKFNHVEMARRNISAIEVAGWLRTIISGSEVGEIGSGTEEIDILVSSTNDISIDRIENLRLPSVFGEYSLREIAEVRLETSPEQIERLDRERIVRVTAASGDMSASQLFRELLPEFEAIEIPEGYEWSIGGENEQFAESTTDIIRQMNIAFLLILITVILQLNSFRKAALVLSIIPLAVAGVFFGFTLFGIPLSFPALIGVLSLFGIVVNNSIMLMEKINRNHEVGLNFYEGIIDACTSRIDTIFFTTATTVIG